MNIGQLAKESGVSAKLIRHYEDIGLVPKVARTDKGYRIYLDSDVHYLRFIKRARELGFSLPDIKKLVSLWKNKSRSSLQVKTLASKHLKELEKKLAQMKDMADTLRHLVHNCHGDSRPDCPILKKLED
ncbi:MAG TPA: Cu(I)-responsive transcriptional regulator [Leptospiraceae bacterium]|nr:Cu(I)-responsive transcriptional regulator [Leptospiraceae bacterium]HMW04963.1 Cu(I)-responsive transcriptional regulator [Leptospiraceae bacterium]HMX31888.1 Cu(I)-responsive transcriptional regulator [Leptospiraceae bacterium]HMY30816.1 Cu(I)-responsive transcriptional regulator [Leptospiraceae bacterium]HMZ64277.1 Cu(I)-responsive transcriptional regulator [Leptospiraceae bacterium]